MFWQRRQQRLKEYNMTKLTKKINGMTEIKHTADTKVIMSQAEVVSELCKGLKELELGVDTSKAIALGFVSGRFEFMDHKEAWKWAEKDLGIEAKVIKSALKVLRGHEHAKSFEGKLYSPETNVVIQIEKEPEHADAFDNPKLKENFSHANLLKTFLVDLKKETDEEEVDLIKNDIRKELKEAVGELIKALNTNKNMKAYSDVLKKTLKDIDTASMKI